jgi:cell wall-associated NlpC family hydrolase
MDVRLRALHFAESQAGKYYCYGGTGPTCYDCSGLVYTAYQSVGVWLPRDTYGMLASSKLREVPASQARPGDLAFYGSGHVELVAWGNGGTIGALDYGTLVGYHPATQWFYPTMYFTVRS